MANQSNKAIIAQNEAIIRRYPIGFIIVALIALLIQTGINYYKHVTPVFPKVNDGFKWNIGFFVFFIVYAWWSARPVFNQAERKVYPGKKLYNSAIIELVCLAIIIQFFVTFTPKALFLYFLAPIYAIYALLKKLCLL